MAFHCRCDQCHFNFNLNMSPKVLMSGNRIRQFPFSRDEKKYSISKFPLWKKKRSQGRASQDFHKCTLKTNRCCLSEGFLTTSGKYGLVFDVWMFKLREHFLHLISLIFNASNLSSLAGEWKSQSVSAIFPFQKFSWAFWNLLKKYGSEDDRRKLCHEPCTLANV